MKIAVVSDDGVNLSQHFGRAPYYVVFAVEEGKVAGREVREKVYHHGQHLHGVAQGSHAGAHDHHRAMATPIDDCAVIVAAGMGEGAYQGLKDRGIEPAFVTSRTAEEAVADYLAGRTIDYQLCQH